MDDLKKAIGNQIAKLRIEKGMTQQELAAKAGIDNSNLSKIERGTFSAGIGIIEKICKALETEVIIRKRER